MQPHWQFMPIPGPPWFGHVIYIRWPAVQGDRRKLKSSRDLDGVLNRADLDGGSTQGIQIQSETGTERTQVFF